MLKQIIIATAAASLAATISSASAGPRGGDCDEFGCGTNGPNLNGVALNGVQLNGIQVRQLSVKAVILPSGEVLDLR
jgi:hypothetical protein